MGIKIIEQSTAERRQETKNLFEQCRPYLEKGEPLTIAIMKVKGLNHRSFTNRAWYKEVRDYAVSQGFYVRR